MDLVSELACGLRSSWLWLGGHRSSCSWCLQARKKQVLMPLHSHSRSTSRPCPWGQHLPPPAPEGEGLRFTAALEE